jgi:hypothetical protein
VALLNNLVLNPPGYQSRWQHLEVRGAVSPAWPGMPPGAAGDAGLSIRGNIVWNGPAGHPLGVGGGGGCAGGNPTCSAAQLLADNWFNGVQPQLVDPAGGNFRPLAGGSLAGAAAAALGVRPLPAWPAWAVPACAGNLSNVVDYDRDGRPRGSGAPPGAYTFGGGARRPAWPACVCAAAPLQTAAEARRSGPAAGPSPPAPARPPARPPPPATAALRPPPPATTRPPPPARRPPPPNRRPPPAPKTAPPLPNKPPARPPPPSPPPGT